MLSSYIVTMLSLNLYQMPRSVRKAAAFALAAGLVIGAIGCRKAASFSAAPGAAGRRRHGRTERCAGLFGVGRDN